MYIYCSIAVKSETQKPFITTSRFNRQYRCLVPYEFHVSFVTLVIWLFFQNKGVRLKLSKC